MHDKRVMAGRRGYVLLRSRRERDGYRPLIVQEGEPGYTHADFLLDLEYHDAAEYLRALNLRSGVNSDDLRVLIESCSPELLQNAEL